MKKKLIFYSGRFLRKIFLFACLFITAYAFAQTVPAPVTGDFRSNVTSGAWNAAGSWQVYDGTSWVATTTPAFPGAGTTNALQGTYRVFIQAGQTITVSSDQTYYFGDVYVLGSPIPNPTTIGTLQISGMQTDFNLLGTNQNIVLVGGALSLDDNNTVLGLLSGNSLIITNFNGNPTTGLDGTNGMIITAVCTGNRQIKFFNSAGGVVQDYAVCGGANSDYRFRELNIGGGSLFAVPSVSPTSICVGQSVNLIGSYTGFIPATTPPKTITYTWQLVSGTVSYSSVTGTVLYPGGTPPFPLPAQPALTLNLAGTYVFSLTVSYDYDGVAGGYQVTSSETVTFTVNPIGSASCVCYKDPVTTGTAVDSQFGITALGRAGDFNANWPMVRKGAHMVLEANTKGMVITRVANPATAITNPVEGMVVYNTTSDCLSIYDGTGWKCFEKQSNLCP